MLFDGIPGGASGRRGSRPASALAAASLRVVCASFRWAVFGRREEVGKRIFFRASLSASCTTSRTGNGLGGSARSALGFSEGQGGERDEQEGAK